MKLLIFVCYRLRRIKNKKEENDGNMKHTSQVMINAVTNITNEQKKQHLALKQMAEGNNTGGGGGDEDQLLNWFDIVTKKLMHEISSLIKCAQKVLFPPQRGHGNSRNQGKS